MTNAHLRPCPACARHVRVSEGACPFCRASLDAAFRAAPAPLAPAARLSRAALFALGAGSISVGAACGGATAVEVPSSQDGGNTAAPDGGDAGPVIAPPYGIAPPPPFDSGTEPPPKDASGDAPVALPPYGIPPQHDN